MATIGSRMMDSRWKCHFRHHRIWHHDTDGVKRLLYPKHSVSLIMNRANSRKGKIVMRWISIDFFVTIGVSYPNPGSSTRTSARASTPTLAFKNRTESIMLRTLDIFSLDDRHCTTASLTYDRREAPWYYSAGSYRTGRWRNSERFTPSSVTRSCILMRNKKR